MPLSDIVLILMLLLAIGMLTAGLFRRLPIPYTVLLVIIGVVLEELASHWEPLAPLHNFRLTPELVMFIFLPTLIFESGLNLNTRQLIKDIAPVMTLALPALLLSTAVVGFGVWMMLPIDLPTALVFGALISATDPVAVVSLFKELGTPERLTVLVEGESLLNDATAIVMFKILLAIALFGGVTWSDAGVAAGEFIRVFFGGAIVGLLFGFLFCWLMRKLETGTSATLILSLVMAYSGFIVAEHSLHLSGVMAVVGSAVVLGGFGVPRLPSETGAALGETWEFLAMICNTLLFILVGLSVELDSLINHLGIILIVALLILVVRAGMIYTLVPVATRIFGLPQITLVERHVMWWGGLKGGLAIAIVLSIPDDMVGRQLLLDLTLGVVLFTLLINAPTIKPMMRLLGLDRLTGDETAELKRGIIIARHGAEETLEQFRESKLLSRAGHQLVHKQIEQALRTEDEDASDIHQFRRLRLDCLRREREVLEELYKAGVIPNYIFLDLKGELVRARESILAPDREKASVRHDNPFFRLESALVRRLREHDWAAGLLERYQNLRISQRVIKSIARILMTEAAFEYLGYEKVTADHRTIVEARYRERMSWFRSSISDIRRDFPDFYQRFEMHLSLHAALARARHKVEDEAQHGAITTKPRVLLERLIMVAQDQAPPLSQQLPELDPLELLSMVPLFAGLPAGSLEKIAEKIQRVHFLADDTIIGEGEHGDALYIIVRGEVAVSHGASPYGESIGELGDGDFFGETALLGGQVRTATVRALRSCTLLRLTRRDVLEMAERYPEIARRLQLAQQSRT